MHGEAGAGKQKAVFSRPGARKGADFSSPSGGLMYAQELHL